MAVLPIREDGTLAEPSDVKNDVGKIGRRVQRMLHREALQSAAMTGRMPT